MPMPRSAIVGRALLGVAHEAPELGELLRLELDARELGRASMLSCGTPPDEGLGEHGWVGRAPGYRGSSGIRSSAPKILISTAARIHMPLRSCRQYIARGS